MSEVITLTQPKKPEPEAQIFTVSYDFEGAPRSFAICALNRREALMRLAAIKNSELLISGGTNSGNQ